MTPIYTYLFGTWEALHLIQYNFTDPELFLSPLLHLSITGRKEEMLFNTWELWNFSTIHNHQLEQLLTQQKKRTKEVLKLPPDLRQDQSNQDFRNHTFVAAVEHGSFQNPHCSAFSGQQSTVQLPTAVPGPAQPKGTTLRGRRALTPIFSGSTTELVLSILLHVLTVLHLHLDLPHFCLLNKPSCFLRDQAITAPQTERS